MPHHDHPHEQTRIEGVIGDVFFHRFVIETADGTRVLADVGPKGAEAFPLTAGLRIVAEGEMKPSELKVARIGRAGAPMLDIEHKKKPGHGPDHHPHAEPGAALRAVAQAGLKPLGTPRRKPKHFEVLARQNGSFVECHVSLDGHIHKSKPVDPQDHKWVDEITNAA